MPHLLKLTFWDNKYAMFSKNTRLQYNIVILDLTLINNILTLHRQSTCI